MAESLLPIHVDPNSPSGRESLNLSPAGNPALANLGVSSFRLRPGDDASCLNLYRPASPRILGAPDSFLSQSRFRFGDTLSGSIQPQNPWQLLQQELPGGVIPVMADANSMQYVLHLQLGEELVLDPQGESPVRLRLVGALRDSLFQSELIMSEKHFLRAFPRIEGFRFFLMETPPGTAEEVTAALEDRLSDYGFDVVPTAVRLAAFHRVENTYLSTFQALGGMGLLLGTFGLGVVLLRNVLERRKEIALMTAVGYHSGHLARLVISENFLLLGWGLLIGVFSAVVAIIPAYRSTGGHLNLPALGFPAAAGGPGNRDESGPPGSAGVPPASSALGCRSVSLRWSTRPLCRREPHGHGPTGLPVSSLAAVWAVTRSPLVPALRASSND